MQAKENKNGQTTFGWRFPTAPLPKVATCVSVRRALPYYVTYPEFVAFAEGEIRPCGLPERDEVLRVCHAITAGDDFLAVMWMRDVKKSWRETLEPRLAFASVSGDVRYWWCWVKSAKQWNVGTYLVLAVDANGRLLRYTFYSDGSTGDGLRSFYIRFHNAARQEEEIRFRTEKELIAGIRRMSTKDDNVICSEECRDEYIQASRNSDGTFYVEYQLYHMPWQMKCDKVSIDEFIRLIKLYCAAGVLAIANECKWTCCKRYDRKPFDLGVALQALLAKAERSGHLMIAKTIRALGVNEKTRKGEIVLPLFVDKSGRPVRWTETGYYLPKRLSKRERSIFEVAATLFDGSCAHYAHVVGRIFAEGKFVGKDNRIALFWEKRAAKLGSTKGSREVVRLTALLDPNREKKSHALLIKHETKLKQLCDEYLRRELSQEKAIELVLYDRVSFDDEMSDKRLTEGDVSYVSKAFDVAYEILGIEE